jgi:hypothetical protein
MFLPNNLTHLLDVWDFFLSIQNGFRARKYKDQIFESEKYLVCKRKLWDFGKWPENYKEIIDAEVSGENLILKEALEQIDTRTLLERKLASAFRRFCEETDILAYKADVGVHKIARRHIRSANFFNLPHHPDRNKPRTEKPSIIDFRSGTLRPQKMLELAEAAETFLSHGFYMGKPFETKMLNIASLKDIAASYLNWEGATLAIDASDIPSIEQIEILAGLKGPFEETEKTKAVSRINAEQEVTRKLIEKFDTKSLKSKDLEMSDFMREYETRLSKNGFLRAWAEAAKARPNMSKPGPKS